MKKISYVFLLCLFCLTSMAQMPQRVLVGYTNTPTNIDPTQLISTPQAGYVAVYATANGGKLTGATKTITENFESYDLTLSTDNAPSLLINPNGLTWNAINVGIKNNKYNADGNQCARLQCAKTPATLTSSLTTSDIIPDIQNITFYAGRSVSTTSATPSLTPLYSNDGTNWNSIWRDHSFVYNTAHTTTMDYCYFTSTDRILFTIEMDGQSAYIQFKGYGNNNDLFIDKIVFTVAVRDYVYTDFSTSETATVTTAKKAFANIPSESAGDARYSETNYSTLPALITLPEAPEQDEKTFLGWKAQLPGAKKSNGNNAADEDLLFQAGDNYLMNENVIFKAVYSGGCENCFRYFQD